MAKESRESREGKDESHVNDHGAKGLVEDNLAQNSFRVGELEIIPKIRSESSYDAVPVVKEWSKVEKSEDSKDLQPHRVEPRSQTLRCNVPQYRNDSR